MRGPVIYAIISTDGMLAFDTCDSEDMLETFQGEVGGYVEQVPVGEGPLTDENIVVLANEDGAVKRMKHNAVASLIAGRPLVGNVVFTGNGRVDWLGLHSRQNKTILGLFEECAL